MSQENIFYFITKEVEFQESTVKGALIEVTAMELNKESGNGMVYRIEEGDKIAESLIGNDVYYGVTKEGKHDNPIVSKNKNAPVVGFVETARMVGNKIKAGVRITAKNLIEAIKNGKKFLFSVGGKAVSEVIKKIGGRLIHFLRGARCNHLQIVDEGTPVGFPNAQIEKLIEINETVMICEGGLCHCPAPVKPSKRKIRIIVEETIEVSGKTGDFEIEF